MTIQELQAAPQTDQANPPQIFERAYYQRLYDIERSHGWARGMRRVMERLLDAALQTPAPIRILDIGCGTGFLMSEVRRRYSHGGQVVGLDISMDALMFCNEFGEKDVMVASAITPPFEAESFDLIICIDTIQHLFPEQADTAALREFARLLAPNGVLYLRTNSALGHVPLQGVDADQYRRYKLGAVVTMLRENGFTVERASYLNAIPGLWGMIKEHLTARRKVSKPIGPGLAIKPYSAGLGWLNALMYGILAVEAWVVGALKIDLPFGHSTVYVARRADPVAAQK